MTVKPFVVALALVAGASVVATAHAQQASPSTNGAAARMPSQAPIPITDYVIGPEDMLQITVWKNESLSRQLAVRPDGKISMPLLNDVQAAGLTPNQLREQLLASAAKFVTDPSVTVIVKQINSRKVFITGQIEKPGPYAINGPTTVVQLISLAGGLKEFTDGKRILIMRTDRTGRQMARLFNYREVIAGKNLDQNIELQPGDTVVVP
jgi:polysaccharide export outer membrane protein